MLTTDVPAAGVSFIHLPAAGTEGPITQTAPVTPAAFDAFIERDRIST